MGSMNTTNLALLELEGPDCATFLQGQLTCDINQTTMGHAQLAACCDLKGRAVASFLVFKYSDAHVNLYCPADVLDNLHQHLHKYAVFSKVTLTAKPQASLRVDEQPNSDKAFKLTGREHALWLTPCEGHGDAALWDTWLLQNGLCFVNQALSGRLIPMMLDYDRLNGINFEKGCYLGQEVIARAHYRGQVKRHLYRANLDCSNDIRIGSDITDAETGQALGLVALCGLNESDRTDGLVVIQDKALARPLQCAGNPITLHGRVHNN